ncbi:hypothetical protein NE237_022537 [Protea cynaroides]|uniref:Uncharacterized protein n=1 Tax=Protea cynaroides TaxID=273540 RepID=A0A9Q0K5X3_9MAGN|nr:hypothetical protein NE237_022537 [Protea cynaroides]
MPELVEFYNSMLRRDSRRDSGAGVYDVPVSVSARNLIGEIENRSAHLLAKRKKKRWRKQSAGENVGGDEEGDGEIGEKEAEIGGRFYEEGYVDVSATEKKNC